MTDVMRDDYTYVRVGETFPVDNPKLDGEGPILEIFPDGNLTLMLLYPDLTDKEYQLLDSGFSRWAVTECSFLGITLAAVTFKFYNPSGKVHYIDSVLHAGLYKDDRVDQLLAGQSNILTSYVLDRRIVRMIRTSGLAPRGVAMLHDIVRKQLSETITPETYSLAVRQLFSSASSKQLFQQGQSFAHRELHDSVPG